MVGVEKGPLFEPVGRFPSDVATCPTFDSLALPWPLIIDESRTFFFFFTDFQMFQSFDYLRLPHLAACLPFTAGEKEKKKMPKRSKNFASR